MNRASLPVLVAALWLVAACGGSTSHKLAPPSERSSSAAFPSAPASGVAGVAGVPGTSEVSGAQTSPVTTHTLVDAGSFLCALLAGGSVGCWSAWSQLGAGHGGLGSAGGASRFEGPNGTFRRVPLGGPAASLSAGPNFACALLARGDVLCWGRNQSGQLGLGDISSRDIFEDKGATPGRVDLGHAVSVARLSCGGAHCCAALRDGRLKCWGENDDGRLGLGDTRHHGSGAGDMGDALPFVDLGPGALVTDISVGSAHACAILRGGRVKCWGDNVSGGLGLADSSSIPVVRGAQRGHMGNALPVVDLGQGVSAVRISAGSGYTCALVEGGRVKCWGSNARGRLGLGSSVSRIGLDPGEMGDALPFVDLGQGNRAVAIDVLDHSCALLSDASVRCWGPNEYAQAGPISLEKGVVSPMILAPGVVEVGAGEAASELMVSLYGTCARLRSGGVTCWGERHEDRGGPVSGGARFLLRALQLPRLAAPAVYAGP